MNVMRDNPIVQWKAGSALQLAVASGMRPVRMDFSELSGKVEELPKAISEITKQLDTHGQLLEQMAQCLNSLKNVTNSGMNDIKKTVGLTAGDVEVMKVELQAAKPNQSDLVRIRGCLRACAKSDTANATVTNRVYLNSVKSWDQMQMEIEDELNMDEEEARAYSMSRKTYPARKDVSTTIRVATPLMRIEVTLHAELQGGDHLFLL